MSESTDQRREAVFTWWKSLEHDTGGRAGLRRCVTVDDVYFQPLFHALRLKLSALGPVNNDQLAAGVAVAVHVRAHEAGKLGAQLAKGGFSELRFRRLIAEDETARFISSLQRALHQLGNKVDLLNLFDATYWWNQGDTKKRLATDFYTNLLTEKKGE